MSSTRSVSSIVTPASRAVSSVVGSRPISCSSFLAALRSSHQHVDHVDRDADRAGLVGDRPRDRLANPPRGVRGELEAAAVLVLVDRPHQARVAFLNEVQEAQAAVAVLLGDRDHQPQVAAGELALDVLRTPGTGRGAGGCGDAGWPGFRACEASCSRSSWRIEAILSAGAPVARSVGELLLELVHAVRRLFELPNERLHAAGAQAQFLDQHEHLFAAADVADAGRRLVFRRRFAAREQCRNPRAAPPSSAASSGRLCGMRACTCSLVSRSVSDTLIVRSNGSSPA